MNKTLARTTADSLTWARVISVVPITILALQNLKWWVFGLYVVAALTDLIDGMFARRAAPAATDFDLDGIADRIFGVATLLWLWLLIPGFVQTYWLPYLPIFVLLVTYVMFVRLRHQRFGVPHLPFGRFSMALFFFLLPVLIVWGDVPWFVHGVLLVALAAELQLAWAFWKQQAARASGRRSAHDNHVNSRK
ncbi:MAG: CDP-alcohol phosphatidyltransferase family protein [Gammaproteobacteria bacterium]|nr:CDP-alcohol phosphatidyltransferase family protein [Gammaproteobacteria bacterium]